MPGKFIFQCFLLFLREMCRLNEDVTHKRAFHRRWEALIPSSDMPHQTASASTSRLSCFFTNPHQSNKSTRKKSWAVNICAVCACGGIRPLAASSLEKQWVGKWPSRAEWLTNAIFSPISWSVYDDGASPIEENYFLAAHYALFAMEKYRAPIEIKKVESEHGSRRRKFLFDLVHFSVISK